MLRALVAVLAVGCAHRGAGGDLLGSWVDERHRFDLEAESMSYSEKLECAPHPNAGCLAGRGTGGRWDPRTGVVVVRLDGEETTFTLRREGDLLLASDGTHTLRLWRQPDARWLLGKTWSDGTHTLALRADGSYTLSAGERSSAGRFELEPGNLVLHTADGDDQDWDARFEQRGELLVLGTPGEDVWRMPLAR
jgi:hypothetical protein